MLSSCFNKYFSSILPTSSAVIIPKYPIDTNFKQTNNPLVICCNSVVSFVHEDRDYLDYVLNQLSDDEVSSSSR